MLDLRLCLALVMPALAFGCRDRGTAEYQARARRATEVVAAERAADSAAYARLPACRLPPAADTAGWRRFAGLPVALPPAFKRDSAAPLYFHGGERWVDGAREFSVVRDPVAGIRGLARSAGDGARRCRLALAGHPALYAGRLAGGRYHASVQRVAPGRGGDLIYSAGSTPADRDLLLRILRPLARAGR